MRLHLLICRACRNYLSNLKVMRDVLEAPVFGELPTEGEGLSEEARERISNALKKK